MTLYKYILAVAILALFSLSCSRLQTAGVGSEVEAKTFALSGKAVFDATGKPASGARIFLRHSEFTRSIADSAKAVSSDAVADTSGSFTIDSVDTGDYTIEVVSQAFASLLRCTLHPVGQSYSLPTSPLKPGASISGHLDNTVVHTPAFVQICGLDRLAKVDPVTGMFRIDTVPEGIYTLRVTGLSADYTPKEMADIGAIAGLPTDVGKVSLVAYGGWAFSKKITLNTAASGAQVAGNVYNFPVLIRLSDSNFIFSEAKTGGADIRFAKATGAPLPYEIAQWDAALQQAYIWVGIDTVYGSDSTQFITLYWGNPKANSASKGADVFNSAQGFQGVWHLDEPGSALALDATDNHFDGTPFFMTSPTATAGAIGAAREFDGKSSYISMLNTENSNLNFPADGTFSVSAWVYADSVNGKYHVIASKADYQYNLEIKNSNDWEFTDFKDTLGWDETLAKAQAGMWKHIVGVRSGTRQYLYVNGVLACDTILTNPLSVAQKSQYRVLTNNFMLGKRNDTTTFYFSGKLDEVRVESRAMSADWARLSYMNQKVVDELIKFNR